MIRIVIQKQSYEPNVQKLYSEYLGAPLSEKSHHLLHTSYTCRATYKK